MPLINNISVPRFGSILSKLFGIKERSVAPTLGTEVLPIFEVNDRFQPETRWLRGERLWFAHTDSDLSGSPPTFDPTIVLGNPLGSGMIVVVEGFNCGVPNDSAVEALTFTGIIVPGEFAGVGASFPDGYANANFLDSNTVVFRDTRWATNAGGNIGHNVAIFVQFNQDVTATGGSLFFTEIGQNFGAIAAPAALTQNGSANYIGRPIVLHPGASIFIFAHNANSALTGNVSFYWCLESWGYERPLEDSEIRPGSS